ncbi:DUF6328 family protein [Caenimonas aquaedulcis]|uniref:Sodium:proton antiporter n=1 Tax=Caenimonas aquaedulcis TaxID=2793270 RepID=A0A931H960_9BURK|nr:DUF6328 family protein [Caenimonas aquaedulcis]MBG9390638.1 hypothetical protein [Caenimonas aquaedulcis]
MSEDVPLKDALGFALDEARMILPGVQALFGFQLIAVFNQRFEEVLDAPGRALFLAALVSIAVSCALLMAPAAYHRQVERGRVSRHLLELASRFIAWALYALMVAIAFDVYLVAQVVTGSPSVALALAALCLALCLGLWYVLPWARARALSRG